MRGMRWRMGVVASLAILCVTLSATALTLARGGESRYVIVRAAQAPPVVETAALDLQKHLAEITGATLPIQTDDAPLPKKAIVLGASRYLDALGVQPDWAALGDEGYLIKTCGESLVIVGGPVRGTAYGVYAFLDEYLGCRWFTPDATRIPKRPTLRIGRIDDAYTPPLLYRESFWVEARDPKWNLRNRINAGWISALDRSHGGGFMYLGVHTFYAFVPPDTYFGEHPEYYSLIDGKRTSASAQLCLTNPDVLRLVIEGVRERMRSDANVRVVDVSQNDCYRPCQCASCQAIVQAEGSEAGPVIAFVNQVADAVRAKFPDRFVGTLAYQYTRKAPKNLAPRENVAPRLCSIECCFSHPLATCSDPRNKTFVEDMIAWKQKSNHLFIWDYTTNFSHYIQPFPNLYSLQPNIQFFIEHGARGIFEQGNYQGTGGGEMAELRNYLLARLLWKPDRDVDREIDEFLEGYYGQAARPLRAYIDFLHRRAQDQKVHIGLGYGPTTDFFGGDFLSRANVFLDRAKARVKNDPVLLKRVQRFRMPVYYVEMMRVPEAPPVEAGQLAGAEKAAQAFFDAVDAWKTEYINEGMPMAVFREAYAARLTRLRAGVDAAPGS